MAHVSPQQVSPGDEITADSVNVPINQIAAQLNGNLDDTNISSMSGSKLAAGTVPESAMETPRQYKVGVIAGSTFSTTGNKSVTGVGFKPKMVRFTLLALTATNIVRNSVGVMTPSESFTTATANSTSSIATRSWSGGNVAFAWLPASSTSPTMSFSYVSMDEDGFTINVTNADASFAVAYEAFG